MQNPEEPNKPNFKKSIFLIVGFVFIFEIIAGLLSSLGSLGEPFNFISGLLFFIFFIFAVISIFKKFIKPFMEKSSELMKASGREGFKIFLEQVSKSLGEHGTKSQLYEKKNNSLTINLNFLANNDLRSMVSPENRRREKLLAEIDKIKQIKKRKQTDPQTIDLLALHEDNSEHWYRVQLIPDKDPPEMVSITRYS